MSIEEVILWGAVVYDSVRGTSTKMASEVLSCSIIGTAGRGGKDQTKLTKSIYDKAIDKAKQVITERFKLTLTDVHLVSGGAAWAGNKALYIKVINHGNYSLVCGIGYELISHDPLIVAIIIMIIL